MLELLKVRWVYNGLDAPVFAWITAASLLLVTFVLLGWLWWRVRGEISLYQESVSKLSSVGSSHPSKPGQGLSGVAFDALTEIFESRPALQPAWRSYASQLIRQRNVDGEDEYWSSESAGATFTEETVIERSLNKSMYTAIPGLITGVGLLVTFLAILVALLEIRLESNRFVGLPLLIQGLSGKFLSSIAALLAAAIFLPFEKHLLHSLTRHRLHLASSIDALVPRLSAPRILANIHRDISEQSEAFRHFNTDLSTKLKQSFNESMGPTLERMVIGIEALNQLLRAAEAQKQDSIVGSIESLLGRLESSIVRTLETMAKGFSDSLSGATMSQFDRVADSLGGAAKLIEGMNSQFQVTQSTLGELVSFAKQSTTEQMALGKMQVEDLTNVLRGLLVQITETTTEQRNLGRTQTEELASVFRDLMSQVQGRMGEQVELGRTQIEALTSVLRELMAKIEETTDTSFANMATTLTLVVEELSREIVELGKKMGREVQSSSKLVEDTARGVIDSASNWSARSAEQLEQLLERHQAHLDRIVAVRGTLDASLSAFKGTLGQFASVAADLKAISTQVGTLVTSAAKATETMQGTQTAIQRVAGITAGQLEKLGDANESQVAVWRQIESAMQRYQLVFGQVEEEAGALLTQIQQHINNYTETTKSGFEGLVSQANDHFSNATKRLGTSVDELAQYLDDLGDVFDKYRKK